MNLRETFKFINFFKNLYSVKSNLNAKICFQIGVIDLINNYSINSNFLYNFKLFRQRKARYAYKKLNNILEVLWH